jgi:arginine exporter protein ArgO
VIGALVAGAVAGYGVALPVGAVATYLVGLGARERFSVSAAGALGVATTDGAFAVVAAMGGVGLGRLLRPVARPLTYLAALVLVVLAARTVLIAVHRRRMAAVAGSAGSAGHAPLRPVRAYLGLLTLTAVNPTTLIYFIAIVLGDQASGGGHSDGGSRTLSAAALFAIGAFGASASWQLFLAGSGAVLGRAIRGPRGQLAIATTSGLIMFGLAGSLLWPD